MFKAEALSKQVEGTVTVRAKSQHVSYYLMQSLLQKKDERK